MLFAAGIGYNIGQITTRPGLASGDTQAAVIAPQAITSGKAAKASPSPKISLPSAQPVDPRVVASKASSSKLYHHPWCSGAQRIKETNKLWFPTEADAIAAGYTLAANCQ